MGIESWDLRPVGVNRLAATYHAEIDLERIDAVGDARRPVLSLGADIRDDSNQQAGLRVLLLAVSLHAGRKAPPPVPISSSAWLPRSPIYLPVPADELDRLTALAADEPEGRVGVNVVLSSIIATTAADRELMRDLPFLLVHSSALQTIWIPAGRWQTFLKAWGFPESRLLPLNMTLPAALPASSTAQPQWAVVTESLTTALQCVREGHWTEAGQELRRCATYMLLTWCVVWGDEASGENVSKAISFIDTHLPQCHSQSGSFPKSPDPNVQRACARWVLLRALMAASNPAHHTGAKPVYTREDVDYLLTALTGLARSFPAFWLEFPGPPQGAGSTTS